MKKLAIITFSILVFSQSAFAGGTVLYMNDTDAYPYNSGPVDPNATYVTKDGVANTNDTNVSTKKKTTRKGKLRIGSQKNDPNTYWNFGRVNFGSGFSSEGSSVRRY